MGIRLMMESCSPTSMDKIPDTLQTGSLVKEVIQSLLDDETEKISNDPVIPDESCDQNLFISDRTTIKDDTSNMSDASNNEPQDAKQPIECTDTRAMAQHDAINVVSYPHHNTHTPTLIEQLIEHGVPVETLSEEDGYTKMRQTFCGRVKVVKIMPIEESSQIVDVMIKCCEELFPEYDNFSSKYVKARMDHMIKYEGTDYFPESKVKPEDMSSVPPLFEFRCTLHEQFRSSLGRSPPKLPFMLSELVDLCMYYFNHVASNKSWKSSIDKQVDK